jgi:transcriptional regulator with XRE-family HTH domain
MNNWLNGLDTSGKIKVLLTAKGKTEQDLADLLGISRATVINHMAENRWDVKELAAIATAYGVEPTDLI